MAILCRVDFCLTLVTIIAALQCQHLASAYDDDPMAGRTINVNMVPQPDRLPPILPEQRQYRYTYYPEPDALGPNDGPNDGINFGPYVRPRGPKQFYEESQPSLRRICIAIKKRWGASAPSEPIFKRACDKVFARNLNVIFNQRLGARQYQRVPVMVVPENNLPDTLVE